jgi:hypothetical protein
MFAEGEALSLVGRSQGGAVQLRGEPVHAVIDYFEEGLPVVNQKGHVVWAYFKDDLRAAEFAVPIPESWIEKTGIVGPKLSTGRFIGDHFRRVAWRNPDSFLGGQDIELLRFQ